MSATIEKTKTFENYWPLIDSKIAVCMSGGVDSSVSIYLLHKKGYEVVGLTGWLVKGNGRCCDNGMVDALKVCEQINVNHISKDLRVLFKQEIIDPFISSYSSGSTPIPCITCNTTIKWGSLMQYAFLELGSTHIATGHYAKLIKDNYGFRIIRPKDSKKDQTYMLWGLTQEVLSKTVFPLGDLTKEEVREIAKEANLVVADKEESQDICFVTNKEGTQGFLGKYLQAKEGSIIESKTGKILGLHQGIHNYTIGQRKGLGVAYSEPLYVVNLDLENNIVYAGTKDDLEGYELIAKDVNWIIPLHVIARSEVTKQSQERNGDCHASLCSVRNDVIRVMAKVRYNSKTSPATVEPYHGKAMGNCVKVIFNEPQSAITPGQAVVFYDENDQVLLGGGWIT